MNRGTAHGAGRGDQQQRSNPRRGPSGAWSRLKPAVIDPLDAFGLPSKGEMRLHNHSNQEAYYTKIVERYMKFCATTGGGEPLEAAFASMSMASERSNNDASQQPPLHHRPSATDRPNDLPNIHLAMRKLREGILGSGRRDSFAQRAYIFIIHASILTQQWESYQPALLHLLQGIHPHVPLSAAELREFVSYHVLDLVCRQDDFAEALIVRRRFDHTDVRVTGVLHSLIREDWPRFWRLKRVVDGYQRSLMGFAEQRVRTHALKCIGRSYMSVQQSYIERSADKSWPALVADGIGWQLQQDGVVMIRKPKVKPAVVAAT